MILKKILRYFLTIVSVSFVATVLGYILSYFIIDRINRRNFGESLLSVSIFKFVTYGVYLFIHYSVKKINSMVTQSLVCFAFEFIFINIIMKSLAGLSLQIEWLLLITSLVSLNLPYVHRYLTKLLNIDN